MRFFRFGLLLSETIRPRAVFSFADGALLLRKIPARNTMHCRYQRGRRKGAGQEIARKDFSMILFGKMHFSLQRTIAIGFALIILLGTALLMLPAASKDGDSLGFVDALFTATSATCVTGLVIKDTYTQFALLGQIVILVLIQIG